jgi:hypothetical protein
MCRRPPDPFASLELAISAARLIGFVLFCFGLTIVVRGGYLNPYHRYRAYFFGAGLVIWVIPGVLLMACSFYLRKRRSIAFRIARLTAILEAAFAMAVLVANLFFTPISPVPILLCVLWLFGMIQLAIQLKRSRVLVRFDAEFHRGFQAIAPTPVLPIDQPTETNRPPDL